MLNKFFEIVRIINLDKRTDRWRRCVEVMDEVGFRAERFTAHFGENNHLAFNRSQWNVINESKECLNALILEDDVEFRQWHHLEQAMSELPADWDCLWLGANVNGTQLERHSDHLFKIRNSFTTHGVAYSGKMMKWIVENFNPDEFPIYDELLRVNVQEQFKCFLIAPMIAWQRPDQSDIWGHHADYTSCFIEGNKLLK
jgi:hypothetical protein